MAPLEPTGEPAFGKSVSPNSNRTLSQIDAEPVRRHLRHHGGRPGAELLGRGLHDRAAVGVQVRAGALGVHEERDGVPGGGHAGADQPVPVALGARPRIAPGPADPGGAALQALPQPETGPGMAGVGVHLGQVALAQLDRVDAELARQFVHRALEREHAQGLARRAGEGGRHRVAAHQPVDALEAGAGVDLGGDAEGGLGPVVERRGDRELVMPDRRQLAVAGRAELDVLLLFLAVAAGGEHLAARHHQPDGAADVLGGQRGEGDVRPDHGLGAERAADEVGQHPDLGRGHPQQRGDRELHGLDALTRVVEGELVAVPGGGGGQHLDRVVVVGGEPEPGVDPQVRGGQPVGDVAARGPARHQAAEELLGLVGGVPALVDRGHRRGLGVADADQAGGVLRLLQAVGDHDRDRLPGVVDDVVLHREERLAGGRAADQRRQQRHWVQLRHVAVGQDAGDALGPSRLRGVDGGDPAAGDPGADDRGVGQVRQGDVAGVVRGAGHLGRAVDPADVLADGLGHDMPPFVSADGWSAC